MIGDVLKREIKSLQHTSTNKMSSDAFWIVLRDIAVREIIEYGGPIDSDTIIPIYYSILSDNPDCVPDFFKQTLASNKQERFRVINRNLFSSNAFHPDGLANQPGIEAWKEINEFKKGRRVVFKKK